MCVCWYFPNIIFYEARCMLILHLFSTVDQPLLLRRDPFFLLHSFFNSLHLDQKRSQRKTIEIKILSAETHNYTWFVFTQQNKSPLYTLSVGSMSISISLPVRVCGKDTLKLLISRLWQNQWGCSNFAHKQRFKLHNRRFVYLTFTFISIFVAFLVQNKIHWSEILIYI